MLFLFEMGNTDFLLKRSKLLVGCHFDFKSKVNIKNFICGATDLN